MCILIKKKQPRAQFETVQITICFSGILYILLAQIAEML